jgi:hypothetical protein
MSQQIHTNPTASRRILLALAMRNSSQATRNEFEFARRRSEAVFSDRPLDVDKMDERADALKYLASAVDQRIEAAELYRLSGSKRSNEVSYLQLGIALKNATRIAEAFGHDGHTEPDLTSMVAWTKRAVEIFDNNSLNLGLDLGLAVLEIKGPHSQE